MIRSVGLVVVLGMAGAAWGQTAGVEPAAVATRASTQGALPEGLSPSAAWPPVPTVVSRPQWIGPAAGLLTPLMGEDVQAAYDKAFGNEIAKAQKGSAADKLATADMLEKMGETRRGTFALAAYADAYRLASAGNAPLGRREALARKAAKPFSVVWDAREDRDVAVLQLRADVLAWLERDAGIYAADELREFRALTNLRLADSLLQVARVKEAGAALAAARGLLASRRDKNLAAHLAYVSEIHVRVAHAAAEYEKLRATLAERPDDPAANARVAVIYLALFRDLDAAAPFAAKAGRVEFSQLVEALATPDGKTSAVFARGAEASRRIGDALRKIAEGEKDSVERYLIAAWAFTRVDTIERNGQTFNLTMEEKVAFTGVVEKLRRLVKDRPAALPEYSDRISRDPKAFLKKV